MINLLDIENIRLYINWYHDNKIYIDQNIDQYLIPDNMINDINNIPASLLIIKKDKKDILISHEHRTYTWHIRIKHYEKSIRNILVEKRIKAFLNNDTN